MPEKQRYTVVNVVRELLDVEATDSNEAVRIARDTDCREWRVDDDEGSDEVEVYDDGLNAVEFDWTVVGELLEAERLAGRAPTSRENARRAVVTIEYEVQIDLGDAEERGYLGESDLRQMAGDMMAELVAQEGVVVAPEAPVRYYR